MLLEIAGAVVLLGLGYGVGYIQGWHTARDTAMRLFVALLDKLKES